MNQEIKYSELRRRIEAGQSITLMEMMLAAGLDPSDPKSVSPVVTEANFPLDQEEAYDACRVLFLIDRGCHRTIDQIRRQSACITGPLGSLYDHPGGLVPGLAVLGHYREEGGLKEALQEMRTLVFLGSTCEYEGGLVVPCAHFGFDGGTARLGIAWAHVPSRSLGDVSYLVSQQKPKSVT